MNASNESCFPMLIAAVSISAIILSLKCWKLQGHLVSCRWGRCCTDFIIEIERTMDESEVLSVISKKESMLLKLRAS